MPKKSSVYDFYININTFVKYKYIIIIIYKIYKYIILFRMFK